LETGINTVNGGLTKTGTAIVGGWGTVQGAIVNAADDVWSDTVKTANEIAKMSVDLGNKCKDLANQAGGEIVSFAEKAGQAVLSELKDLLNKMCTLPGAKTAVKEIIQFLIDRIMCAGLNVVGIIPPFCLPIGAAAKALKIVITFTAKNAFKCSVLKGLSQLPICMGKADWFSDVAKDAMATLVTGGLVSPFSMVSSAIVECMCGACPMDCNYSNRQVCDAATDIINAGWKEITPAPPTPAPTVPPTTRAPFTMQPFTFNGFGGGGGFGGWGGGLWG